MAASLLILPNFSPVNIVETTRLNADANASQATITLENADNFATGDFLAIQAGDEQGEVRRIQSIAGQTITLTASLTFKHLRYAAVIKFFGDKLKLYRAANNDGSIPSDTSFTHYTSAAPVSPTTIPGDQFETDVTDPFGGTDYWYKYTFLNSVTSAESDLSLSEATRGGDFGHYVTLDEIRREAGFTNNSYITDDDISDARESAEAEIDGILGISGYTLPLSADVPILRIIAKLLAAGYLLGQEYGAGAEGTNKEALGKKKEARDMLTGIRTNTIVLVDSTGLPLSQGDGPGGLPDDATVSATDDPRPPVFSMADRY